MNFNEALFERTRIEPDTEIEVDHYQVIFVGVKAEDFFEAIIGLRM